MSRTIWDITLLYLKTTYNNRAVLIFQLLMPVLFTFMIGAGTGNFNDPGPTSTTVQWELALVNEDAGELGAELQALLVADGALVVREMELETAVTAITADELLAALVIPVDFSQQLLDTGAVNLQLHSDPEDVRQVQPLEQVVFGLSSRLQGATRAAAVSRDVAGEMGLFADGLSEVAYFAVGVDSAQDAWNRPPVVVIVNEDERIMVSENVIPDGIDQSSPGMMAMFATFSMFGGAVVLLEERRAGTLRRLLVMPIRRSSILIGKLLGILLAGMLQMLILILFGALAFDVAWGNAPAALALLVFAFALAITSLGMMFAALARTLAQANALSTVIVLSISALGGAWWPLEIVPDWMQLIGRLSPISWGMTGFHDIITRGQGVAGVLPEVGVLLGFTVVFLTIGIWRFRFE